MTEIITNEVNMIDTECECDLMIAIIFCRYLENQRPVIKCMEKSCPL